MKFCCPGTKYIWLNELHFVGKKMLDFKRYICKFRKCSTVIPLTHFEKCRKHMLIALSLLYELKIHAI